MIRKSRNGNFHLIDGDSHIGAWCEANGTLAHDTNMLPLILPNIPEGGVVVDAGAYCGTHTFPYLERVGRNGTVLAFEPNKEAFDCLRLNCPEAFCSQVALSDHAGTGRLIQPSDMNYGTCRVLPGELFHLADKNCEVEMMTLDSLVLRRCDFVKLDVEGSELRALQGAAETIQELRPTLLVEVNQSALEGMGTSPDELLAFIRSLNYDVRNIYPNQPLEGPQFDVLCKPI